MFIYMSKTVVLYFAIYIHRLIFEMLK